jgi:hypothetical protein
MGLRDTILNADDIESRTVDVPEWGVKLELRTPTVRARGEIISAFMRQDGEAAGTVDVTNMNPVLVVMTAHDPETGELVFTRDDVDTLMEKSAAVMERLGEIALELAGLENAAERMAAGKDGSPLTRNSDTPMPSPSGSIKRSRSSTRA